MITSIFRWFAGGEPSLSSTSPRDAAALAKLHDASFGRGWSEDEFEHLLLERNIIGDRAVIGRKLVGFIISRQAADEAEILSIAVAPAQRGQGLARRLLDRHLRRLAGLGVRAVFLEVDEGNAAARRLYARTRFRDIGRRPAYYSGANRTTAAALVLRRDLA